jgi:hypothetical protein
MLRVISLAAAAALVASCAEPLELCDEPFFDLEPQVCAVGSPCNIPLNIEGTFTVTGNLPEGVTVTADGLEGTPTTTGTWPLSIEITNTTTTSGADSCEPTTVTRSLAFSTVERQCVDNGDCRVLNAGSVDRSACTATSDCLSEFDHCVAYMDGGLCIAEASCAADADRVTFTSVEGDGFNGCTSPGTGCLNGLCT